MTHQTANPAPRHQPFMITDTTAEPWTGDLPEGHPLNHTQLVGGEMVILTPQREKLRLREVD